jgi:FkbM family methyltransferase
MLKYLKNSFARKKARRFTAEYPVNFTSFDLPADGSKIEFANWANPLVPPITLTQGTIDFYKKFIRKGSLTIDIGANTGDTTVPIAVATGTDGLTIGFEPSPFAFKVLTVNAGLNKDKTNIVALPFAIADKEQEFYYSSSEASFSNGGISAEKPTGNDYILKEKIRGIKLEDYLNQHYKEWISKLSFIKIDTEGYDKEIIKNIIPLIKKYKPVIVAEFFGEGPAKDRVELFELFINIGYEVYYFRDFDTNTTIEQLKNKEDVLARNYNFNAYAIPVN